MRRLPQNLSVLAVSILTVSAVAVAPVYARDGGGSSDSSPDSTNVTTASTITTDDSGTTTGGGHGPSGIKTEGTSGTDTSNENEQVSEVKTTDIQDLREQAQKLLQNKRQNGKTKTTEQRQQACDAHKTELTTRRDNYERNAQKHLGVFDSIYTKVLAFQADKQLTATNFDSLKATADAKQTAAKAAVAALSDADISIDCTSQDPATNVAALKTAVAAARTALQDYRTAIKNVIVALENAKSTDSTNTTTNSTTNTEAN